MNTLNQTILHNLIIERELCIAKLQVTAERLERLEEQIAEQRMVVEREDAERVL